MSKNIIVNFPSNIGDTVMSLPVVEALGVSYPSCRITAIVSPKTEQFLSRHSLIDRVVLFDKAWPMSKKAKFAISLRHKYDIFVDLKNSMLPLIVAAKKRTPFVRHFPHNTHKKDTYLALVRKLIKTGQVNRKGSLYLGEEEKSKWDKLGIKKAIFVACASRSHIKQYPYSNLKAVVETIKRQYPVVVLGEERDRSFYKDILSLEGVIDLVGKTQMWDIFYLIEKYAAAVIAVDSSILHLSSFLEAAVVSVFGPTDAAKFGPWSTKQAVLRNSRIHCAPCEKAACKYNLECMDVSPQKVIEGLAKLMQ